jgi:murein DD-endopeptidase MepM/ murein hydrolase activator NlpD
MIDFSAFDFAPIMNYPDPDQLKVFDFKTGYNPDYIRSFRWGIGKYDEKRLNMYTAHQYESRRNIHMGLDIWSEAGQPVFSFYDGTVCYTADNHQPGNYGPTLVLRYILDDQPLFALYGHLSGAALERNSEGKAVHKAQQIAAIGSKAENGGWPPHLHFQISRRDPGKADMPGVISEENHQEALENYLDPRLITGPLY